MSDSSTNAVAPRRRVKIVFTEIKYLAVVLIGCYLFAYSLRELAFMIREPAGTVWNGLIPQMHWVIAAFWGCYVAIRHATRHPSMKVVLCVVAIVASVAGSGSWRAMRFLLSAIR
jgi:hypothetical protein